LEGPQADFVIAALIAERLDTDIKLESVSAAKVFIEIGEQIPAFDGLTYQELSKVRDQWPVMGRDDLYYGGTGYANKQGLGVQLPLSQEKPVLTWPQVSEFKVPKLGMTAFPVTRLYDSGTTLSHSDLLNQRIGEPHVLLNAKDAKRINVQEGSLVRLIFSGQEGGVVISACLDESLPERIVLVPRSFGIPISAPTAVEARRDT
jgi:NADH-quinone oxidoreductase subunit G